VNTTISTHVGPNSSSGNFGWGYNATCVWITTDPFCADLPTAGVIGETGLNMSVATTPANGTGPAPLTFGWNVAVTSGGLPPYRTYVVVTSPDFYNESTNGTGNLTLGETGLYDVVVMAEDSSCTQVSFVEFGLQVWGSLGPNPVQLAASSNATSVPATVSYQVNTSALPTGWSLFWDAPGIFVSPDGMSAFGNDSSVVNATYFFPGNYSAEVCFVQPDSVDYGCGVSPTIALTGSSPVATSVVVGTGPYPVNVTFSATIVNAAGLPNGTSVVLSAPTAGGYGVSNSSSGTASANLTVAAGCGYPWTYSIPPTGVCVWTAEVALIATTSLDNGFLGLTTISANLSASGTPSTWYPSVSYSYGPLNGSLPLNFSLNFSAANGVAPYAYSYTVVGRASGSANTSFYPPMGGQVYGWNGSTVSLVLPLNSSGIYWINVFVADASDQWVTFSPPLLVLGNVSPLRPLSVSASGPSGTAAVVAGSAATFLATATGGDGPLAVEWNFDDGTYGSSLLGATVSHVYLVPGRYTPTVTVTDGAGHSVTETLPTIVVTAAPAPASPPTTSAPGVPSYQIAWLPVAEAALVGAAFVLVGELWARREVQKDGEALVESLKAEGASKPSDEPPHQP
jgi:hypothetical protein